jgi:hypothetical protein
MPPRHSIKRLVTVGRVGLVIVAWVSLLLMAFKARWWRNLIPNWLVGNSAPTLEQKKRQAVGVETSVPALEQEKRQAIRDEIWHTLDLRRAWADREIRPIVQRVNEQCLDGQGEIDIDVIKSRGYKSTDPADYWIQCTLAWGRGYVGSGKCGGYLVFIYLKYYGQISVRPMSRNPVVQVRAGQPGWERQVESALRRLVQKPSACEWCSEAPSDVYD